MRAIIPVAIVRLAVLAVLAVPLALAALPAAARSAPHDGRWSVLVITDKGTCDVYRWTITVAKGRVIAMAKDVVTPAGRISRSGRVNLSFRRGRDVMMARGRISRTYGSGSWRASVRKCVGRWRAERL